jgi:Mu-like prophage I protein.
VAWLVSKDGTPMRIKAIALTNTPNTPVRPILNSADYNPAENNLPAGDGAKQQPQKPKTNMNEILKALGLEETADTAAVLAKIKELTDSAAAARTEKEAAEAKLVANSANAFADKHAGKVKDRATLVELYTTSPDMAEKFVAGIKVAPVVNSAAAAAHIAAKGPVTGSGGDVSHKQAMAALPVGKRKEYYAAHKAEIDAE